MFCNYVAISNLLTITARRVSITMVNCSPLRRVELFFIKFFTICIKCIKKNHRVIKNVILLF
ncbi:hypothetical protein C5O78_05430 [Treponema phagedenis]|nr:hypothetical protein C5O78_05430 [Treponema phagedenis]